MRLAQGLVHAGKGLVTMSPYHPDRSVPHTVAMAGLIVITHLCLDFKTIVLGKHHFLLYVFACCIRSSSRPTHREHNTRAACSLSSYTITFTRATPFGIVSCSVIRFHLRDHSTSTTLTIIALLCNCQNVRSVAESFVLHTNRVCSSMTLRAVACMLWHIAATGIVLLCGC